jgi:hypothetical protein
MESAVFGFIGALVGAVLGFIGSVLSVFGKSKDTQLTVLTQVITTERAQWRSDMRSLTSELVPLLHQIKDKKSKEAISEFHQLRVKIRLRLNPKEGHEYDQELLSLLGTFEDFINSADNSQSKFDDKIEKFEITMQKLIKKEWDKSKKEAESGNLGASDKTHNQSMQQTANAAAD